MSILLDALRKSEQRERLGAAPDIHSPEPGMEAAGPPAWRTPTLVVLVGVLLLGGVYVGWQWWNDRRVPVAAPEFTGSEASATTAAERASSSDPDAGAPGTPAPADVAPGAGTASMAGGPTTPRLDSQPRSPVENLSGDRPYRPATSSTAAAEPTETVPRLRTQEISDADLDAAINQAEAAAQARAARRQARAQREMERRQRQQEQGDGSISFWQLPENVRGGLPEFKINVMVFDEDPGRRFIIMGGKRYLEGDEISGNLTLEEVQRDRALFRYGAYLFYVRQ